MKVAAVILVVLTLVVIAAFAKPMRQAAPVQTAQAAPVAADTPLAPAAVHEAKISWQDNLDKALAQAKHENKPVIADFMASWCGPCQEMERTTWQDPAVAAAAAGYIMVKQDVDKHQDAAQKYGVEGIPNIVFIGPDGKVKDQQVGLTDAADMIALMTKYH